MLTTKEVHDALYALQALNLNYQVRGQAEFWTPALNEALPELTASDLARIINYLATRRDTTVRSGRLTPADIVDAARRLREGDLEAQRVRLRAEIARGGPFTAEGIQDPTVDLSWRQTAVRAFMGGASREEAEQEAWRHINMNPPTVTNTRQYPVINSLRGNPHE